MKATRFHLQWSQPAPPRGFRTGVSLHSHTLHSKESLDFIYKLAKYSSALRWTLRRGESNYRNVHGVELDLNRAWWTPPLAPLDAYRAEAGQIEALGLPALVSLTDHDDIEAPMSLQAVDPARVIPVSVEWTVPYGTTFFHLGLHNLPARLARHWMTTLAEYTAKPSLSLLKSILAALDRTPGVLLVFNHPLWDEKGIGEDVHKHFALDFMRECGVHMHALEMNGLRPWTENRAAIQMAGEWNKPVVAGGDRHAVEPNAVINLTSKATFEEFADEVRGGVSDVFVATHYRQGYIGRVIHNLIDVLKTYENHGNGWREWPDRVFYHCPDDVVRSLRELWGEDQPCAVRIFDSVMRLAGREPLRNAMRIAYARGEQVTL